MGPAKIASVAKQSIYQTMKPNQKKVWALF